jgi:GntR family transcriptional regulator, transcriptional repressor for pyruvate dehydrogenase complex
MIQPISRDSVVDALVERLRVDVLAGRYPPGSYLPPERELAAGLGVTRTSLKHAFVRLIQEGLLETKHGVGTRVRDYTRLGSLQLLPMLVLADAPGWLTEIFELRQEAGALFAAKAAVRATPAHRERLGALQEQIRTAADTDTTQLTELEIHRVIAEATGNRVYRQLADLLFEVYLSVRTFLQAPFTDPVAAAERIRPLVDAVVAGDATQAHRIAEDYLAETGRLMLASLGSDNSATDRS